MSEGIHRKLSSKFGGVGVGSEFGSHIAYVAIHKSEGIVTKVSRNPTFAGRRKVSASDFQSEVGEVFGEIGGELPAKFGRRFSSFFRWGKIVRSILHQNSTANFIIKLHYEVLGCRGP